jgi:hypothetical protein
MTQPTPGSEELSALLGQSYEVYTLVNGFIDCFYQAEIFWGKKGKHGIYSTRYLQKGKSLCTIFINKGYFTMMLVYGKKEQEAFEAADYRVCGEFQKIYDDTYIYPEGKWVWLDLYDTASFADIKHFLSVKMKPDNNAMTMCGYKCNLCSAYAKNIKKNDRREELSAIWKKYYGLDMPKEEVFCDGCRCATKDARLVDEGCPVRKCVINKKIAHCGDCPEFPCGTLSLRAGLNCSQAKEKAGGDFDDNDYTEYLLAYDNMTRLSNYQKSKQP